MSPKEIRQLNASLDARVKKALEDAAKNAGMSQTAYLECLIEGTLPGRLEAEIKELRLEVEAMREQLMKQPKRK